MNIKDVDRRLARLESEARHQVWAELEALSDQELGSLLAARPPDPEFEAAVRALSDDDLDRTWAGLLSGQAIRRMYAPLVRHEKKILQ